MMTRDNKWKARYRDLKSNEKTQKGGNMQILQCRCLRSMSSSKFGSVVELAKNVSIKWY